MQPVMSLIVQLFELRLINVVASGLVVSSLNGKLWSFDTAIVNYCSK